MLIGKGRPNRDQFSKEQILKAVPPAIKRCFEKIARLPARFGAELCASGKKAFQAGDYRASEGRFLAALAAGADQTLCRRYLARIYNAGNESERALEQWQWLRDAAPTEVEPQLQIARIHFKLGHPEEAIEALHAVLRLSPGHTGARRILSHLEKVLSGGRTQAGMSLKQRFPERAERGVVEWVNQPAPVTVALTTYNRAHYLADAVRSCREQSVRPEQIIVVDDGSSDETGKVVQTLTGADLRYVNVGKIGIGLARNLATSLCTTKYICVMDDDDIMLPNRIRDHMASCKLGQISHGGWINFNVRGELDYQPGKRLDEDSVVYVGLVLTHGACCYETAVLREFPYRQNIIGEDYDLAIRLVRSGLRWVHTESYVLLRRLHSESVTANFESRQDKLRDVVRSAINQTRTNAEIGIRIADGRKNTPLIGIDTPALSDIFRIIGEPKSPLRIKAEVPRLAIDLFSLLDRLGINLDQIQLFDNAMKLSSTITLVSRPFTRSSVVERFEASLRTEGLKVGVVAHMSGTPTGPIDYATPVGSFRVILANERLETLIPAHGRIALRRDWSWYLTSRPQGSRSGASMMYYLVSSPFRKRDDEIAQTHYRDTILSFVAQAAGFPAAVIEGREGG